MLSATGNEGKTKAPSHSTPQKATPNHSERHREPRSREAQDVKTKIVRHLPVQVDGAVEVGTVCPAFFTWRYRHCRSTITHAKHVWPNRPRGLSSQCELHDQVQEFGARTVRRRVVRVGLAMILGVEVLSVFPRWRARPPANLEHVLTDGARRMAPLFFATLKRQRAERCEASKLGSELRASQGFQDRIWGVSVRRRLRWSERRAGPGRRRGDCANDSGAGSRSA